MKQVSGNAFIYGNLDVSGTSVLFGNVFMSNNLEISGNTIIECQK